MDAADRSAMRREASARQEDSAPPALRRFGRSFSRVVSWMNVIEPPEHGLQLREIVTEAQFMQLRESWNRLAADVGATVFQRHEWLTAAWAWCRHSGRVPWIVCVFGNDRLVGALPLLKPSRAAGGGRPLGFMCIPDSQWCDALICPAVGAAVGRLLAGHLAGTAARWDVLRLERLAEGAAASRWLLPALAAHGIAGHLQAVGCNPCVDLESSWAGYRNGLSRSLRKSCNLAANRLARAGTVQLQWITAETVGQDGLQRLLDEVVSISAHSWKRDTGNALDRPAPQAFIRTLTDIAVAERWLSVWLLRVDGRPVAMEYQLVVEGVVHALRADFDDRLSKLCAGTYLNFLMLERMFAEPGLRRYYMGPGNNPYKTRWSRSGDPVCTLTAFAPTMRGRGSKLWFDIKPRLSTLKDRFMPGAAAT